MRQRDHRDLVDLLLRKAAADEKAVEQLLDAEVDDEIIGFHAQQACEKLLKAVLASRQVRYPYTHVLAALLDQVAAAVEAVPQPLEAVASLTPFGVIHRYEALPDDDEPLDRAGTLALVRDLREWATGVVASAV